MPISYLRDSILLLQWFWFVCPFVSLPLLALIQFSEREGNSQVCSLSSGRSRHNNLEKRSSNQFIEHHVAVKENLKVGSNELILYFESAFLKVCCFSLKMKFDYQWMAYNLKGRQIEKQHGKFSLWNGDSSRLHVRKAQYK